MNSTYIHGLFLSLVTVLLLSYEGVTFADQVPIPLQSLQLTQPFTITYRADAGVYTNGRILPTKLQVALSYDGRHLLYRSNDLSTHIVNTVLYNGQETYEIYSNSPIAVIEPGFNYSRMEFCPLPGVGFPHLPLFIHGFQPQVAASLRREVAPMQNSEPKYIDHTLYLMPGQTRSYGDFWFSDREAGTNNVHAGIASAVTVTDANIPKVLWYDTFDNIGTNLGTLWEFFSAERFEGVWIATKIRMRSYVTLRATGKNTLFRVGTYDLSSASNKPLGSSAYEPETYLPSHANITDLTGPVVKAFIYQAGKASLQQQRGSGLKISESLALNSKSSINTGLIGLVTIIIVTTAWFMWRRTRERQ